MTGYLSRANLFHAGRCGGSIGSSIRVWRTPGMRPGYLENIGLDVGRLTL